MKNYVNVTEPSQIETILKRVHVLESLTLRSNIPICIFFESYYGKGYLATHAYNGGFEIFIEERVLEYRFSYEPPKDESRISETARFRIQTLCKSKPIPGRQLLERELAMNSDIAEFLCIEELVTNGEY